MLQRTDRNSVEFRQAILKSMSLLTAPAERSSKVRNELLRRIMEFEPPIVAAIAQYVLSGVATDDRTAFRNTYITLRKRIDFEQLRMTRSRSATPILHFTNSLSFQCSNRRGCLLHRPKLRHLYESVGGKVRQGPADLLVNEPHAEGCCWERRCVG